LYKAKSWTSEYSEVCVKGQPNSQVLDFKEVFSEKVEAMPSKIRVFENPLVSLDTVGMLDNNHQDVSRSMSLMTNPTRNLASTSTETFTSNKLSPKYIKYNKKDIMELSELSPMSPVEKRKMSKATDMMLEQYSMKSNMAMAGTNKRTSVVFNLMEEGNSDVRENEDFPPCPAHHFMRRISEFGQPDGRR
jgi:hypothetical protein